MKLLLILLLAAAMGCFGIAGGQAANMGDPAGAPSAQYFYSENGRPVGPLSLEEIKAKIAAGVIKADTLVWKGGSPSWVAAKDLPEIATILAGGPVPAPAPAPAPPPAPTPNPVAAGCMGKVLLSDDYRQVDDSWGVAEGSDSVTVEDGKVKIKPDPNGTYKLLYNGQPFDDADYCVTVQAPNNLKDVNDTVVLAGLVFWSADGSNFYDLQIAPNGQASVGRLVRNRWNDPVPWHVFAAVKKGAGARNMLRVSTSGNVITTYINGQRFATVKAQVPEGGGLVGLWTQSEKSSRDTWKFYDLKVTEHAK